jgi:hypothetical protein
MQNQNIISVSFWFVTIHIKQFCLRRVWRFQRGNQNPYIEDGLTTQLPKEKGQTLNYKTLHRKLKIEQHEPH